MVQFSVEMGCYENPPNHESLNWLFTKFTIRQVTICQIKTYIFYQILDSSNYQAIWGAFSDQEFKL